MIVHRNIDLILDDAIFGVVNITSYPGFGTLPEIGEPEIGENVQLQPSDWNHRMLVKISWMSEDKETFRGEVINGYYPPNEEEESFIKEGEIVEFSKNKIIAINHDK